MPTVADYLETARLNAAMRLAELDALPVAERPVVTYSQNGRTVNWGEYRASLVQELATLTDLAQKAGGPFTVVHRARG